MASSVRAGVVAFSLGVVLWVAALVLLLLDEPLAAGIVAVGVLVFFALTIILFHYRKRGRSTLRWS